LEQLGAEAATAMLVGDSPWDVEAARNLGFPSWCVTTGTHSAQELAAAGADKIFPDLVALNRELISE
jgi:phosphoglycolate phosphatase